MAGSEDRKAELIARLAVARGKLDRSSVQVRETFDVKKHIRQSFARHVLLWLGGATVVGVVLAKLPARSKKVYVDPEGKRVTENVAKAGLLAGALRLAFTIARPMLVKLATERLRPMAEEYFQRRRGAV